MRGDTLARLAILAVCAMLIGVAGGGCGSDGEDSGAATSGDGSSASGEGANEGGSSADGTGGGGDRGGAEAADVSSAKERFLKRGNSLCRETSRGLLDELEAHIVENRERFDAEQKAFLVAIDEVLLARLEDQIRKIRGLEVPQGDEDEVEAFLRRLEQSIEEVRATDALVEGEQPFYGEFGPAGRLARAYGLRDCDYGA